MSKNVKAIQHKREAKLAHQAVGLAEALERAETAKAAMAKAKGVEHVKAVEAYHLAMAEVAIAEKKAKARGRAGKSRGKSNTIVGKAQAAANAALRMVGLK